MNAVILATYWLLSTTSLTPWEGVAHDMFLKDHADDYDEDYVEDYYNDNIDFGDPQQSWDVFMYNVHTIADNCREDWKEVFDYYIGSANYYCDDPRPGELESFLEWHTHGPAISSFYDRQVFERDDDIALKKASKVAKRLRRNNLPKRPQRRPAEP